MLEFISRKQAEKLTGLSYLGKVGSSSKIMKNSKVLNIDTFVLYLAPHKLSGYNTCLLATKSCIIGCLNTSGQAGMQINTGNKVIKARIKKTKLFFEQKDFFMNWLIVEIKAAKNLSTKQGNQFAIRLNGTSDINWNVYKVSGKTIFEHFPDIQFYEYTKVASRFEDKPKNLHLTFSFTGYNWNKCKTILDKGFNVAVVFDIFKTHNMLPETIVHLPTKYNGYKVIDGDVTDYRPFDRFGSIVALRFKHIANKLNQNKVIKSKFVVNPDSKDCTQIKN